MPGIPDIAKRWSKEWFSSIKTKTLVIPSSAPTVGTVALLGSIWFAPVASVRCRNARSCHVQESNGDVAGTPPCLGHPDPSPASSYSATATPATTSPANPSSTRGLIDHPDADADADADVSESVPKRRTTMVNRRVLQRRLDGTSRTGATSACLQPRALLIADRRARPRHRTRRAITALIFARRPARSVRHFGPTRPCW